MSLIKKLATIALVLVGIFSGSTKQLLNIADQAGDSKSDHSGSTGI